MADDTTTGAEGTPPSGNPGGTPPTVPSPSTAPWYQGKIEGELLGHAQNKGWKLDDPAALAVDALKAHKEAEKYVGVPAEQLLRLPKQGDEAGWDAVWQRLGAPKDAKEYDFTDVKFADGSALDDGFAEMIRQTASTNHIPKDAATAFARSVVKFMEDKDKNDAAVKQADLQKERDALQASWGKDSEYNYFQARQAAQRLGLDPETVDALESVTGYSKLMEALRKIASVTNEDTFVDGGGGNTGQPRTREAAQARLRELQSDPAWAQRFLSGDAQAKREFDALTQQIAA